MTFATYLQTTSKTLDVEVEKFFTTWTADISKTVPHVSSLVGELADACQGGKRWRGTLMKIGYDLSGSAENFNIFSCAMALEIFHTAILAHDDIIDKSLTRRGKPALYQKLGSDHYGISQTICLGDLGFFLGYKLIAESTFSDKNKNRAMQLFADTIIHTALGEMFDVALPKQQHITEHDVMTISELKTAYYTVTGPLQIGFALGSLDESTFERLGVFGKQLGTAFQIQDDIADIFSSEKKSKKTMGMDISEGKQTLLITKAKMHATVQQKEVINRYYGKGVHTDEAIDAIKMLFIETGAFGYAKKIVADLIAGAKQEITSITKIHDQQTLLYEMCDYIANKQ